MQHRRDRYQGVSLMAIESNTFGETAWFRDDLLPIHFYHYLNAMTYHPQAVLLSQNFKEKFNVHIGESIIYTFTDINGNRHEATGIVYGFVDHFPTYEATQLVSAASGEIIIRENYLIIANLYYLRMEWGAMPYEIWMRTNADTNRFLYDFLEANNIYLDERTPFSDVNEALYDSRTEPFLQGTNGVLTVGFIVVNVVCFIGFLIYWILSIRNRALQFGIFRAMGMSMRHITAILVVEQILITLMAVAVGIGLGVVTSHYFMPLVQMADSVTESVIPLLVHEDPQDYINLYTVIGTMIGLCFIAISAYIARMNVTQVLKLGED
jgi:putative ABC transport system permease protein